MVLQCDNLVPRKMWPQRNCVRPVSPFLFRLHVEQGTDDSQENDGFSFITAIKTEA